MFRDKLDIVGMILFFVLLLMLIILASGCEECQSSKVREVDKIALNGWYSLITTTCPSIDYYKIDYATGFHTYFEFSMQARIYDILGQPLEVPGIRIKLKNEGVKNFSDFVPAISMLNKIYSDPYGIAGFRISCNAWPKENVNCDYYISGRLDNTSKVDYEMVTLGQTGGAAFFQNEATIKGAWFCSRTTDLNYMPSIEIEPPAAETANSSTFNRVNIKVIPLSVQEQAMLATLAIGQDRLIKCDWNYYTDGYYHSSPANALVAQDINLPSEINENITLLFASITVESNVPEANIADQLIEVYSFTPGKGKKIIEHDRAIVKANYIASNTEKTLHLFRTEYISISTTLPDRSGAVDNNQNRCVAIYTPLDSQLDLNILTDGLDFTSLCLVWLTSDRYYDVNGDGIVNFTDYTILTN